METSELRVSILTRIFSNVEPDTLQLLQSSTDEGLCAFANAHNEPEDYSDAEDYVQLHLLVFAWTGSFQHIEKSLIVAELWQLEVLDRILAIKSMDPWRHQRLKLSNKAMDLLGSHQRSGLRKDLEDAIQTMEKAFTMVPPDHEDLAIFKGNLGTLYGPRFNFTKDVAELDRAIELIWEAVISILPDGAKSLFLGVLRSFHKTRFKLTHNVGDLEQMADVASMAIDATPVGSPDRPSRLYKLGRRLDKLFDYNGSSQTLDRVIEVVTAAVETAPTDYPDRTKWSDMLAMALGRRFQRLGDMADLNRAIQIAEDSLAQVPPDHLQRTSLLYTLGALITLRYNQTEEMEDLNRAIVVLEDMPPFDPNRVIAIPEDMTPVDRAREAGLRLNLGQILRLRFERTKNIADLDRSIDLLRAASKMIDYSTILSTLGTSLKQRYDEKGDIQDLTEAIDVSIRAVDTTAAHNRNLGLHLNQLGLLHKRRHNVTGDIKDLDEAVRVLALGVDATPPEHSEFAGRLDNLGLCLGNRYKKNGSAEDLEWSKSCYHRAINSQSSGPADIMSAIHNATRLLARELGPEKICEYLEKAINLLVKTSPMYFQQNDKQQSLAKFPGIASDAAAAALNAGKGAFHALQLLELGRGVITDHFMKMRTNLSDLEEKQPDLAAQFIFLRDKLDPASQGTALSISKKVHLSSLKDLASAGASAGVSAEASTGASTGVSRNQRVEAEKSFHDLCEKIREIPGFEKFLLPPSAEELMSAANPDPIAIINVSSIRCDALIVEKNRIRNLELPGLTSRLSYAFVITIREAKQPEAVKLVLEWMWETVARPVLEALGFTETPTDDNWPRVWWIPTGYLSQLPLHAAGRHFQSPRSNEAVLDRVMSSYSLSIKALMYGRQQQSTQEGSDKALMVAVPETAGQANLPYAMEELKILESLCAPLHPVIPELKRDLVLQGMRDCKIFHFAGHGLSDPSDPLKSCLLLQEGIASSLNISDIRDTKLQDNAPFLAYLSACSTGAVEAEGLVDEGINLINACQLAGFRHVIGTLWEVSDPYCVDVARVLYEVIRDEGMTDRTICRGLHKAIKTLRDKAVDTNLWAKEAFTIEEVDEKTIDIDMMKLSEYLENLKLEEDESPTASASIEVVGISSGSKAASNRSAAEFIRNAKLLSLNTARYGSTALDFYWVPYVHFGV
ncbi:hypothetical protein TWF694_011218 [Orbilia ellipsospora]|uniref:CHAT domain-containing protein n=1 Tax=Orbilia ellipsospora TaxID=2528407 RepID=A0AAV9X9E7_9PEZI